MVRADALTGWKDSHFLPNCYYTPHRRMKESVDIQPALLDLFCKAGGAGYGYHLAGFRVVGVALEFLESNWQQFDAVHASPPCQKFSILTPTEYKDSHADLIAPLREILLRTGLPYIIENVSGARKELINPIMLCGSMFGLKTHRHRYFELGFDSGLILTRKCRKDFIPTVVSGTTKRLENGRRREHTAQECRDAMQIQWMTRKELDEAIPPTYTEFLGGHLLNYLNGRAVLPQCKNTTAALSRSVKIE